MLLGDLLPTAVAGRVIPRWEGAGALALVLLVVGCAQPQAPDVVDSIDAAETAYFRFDRAGAASILERIAADADAPVEDRSEALRLLARFAALFDQDRSRALLLLDEAEALGVDEALASLERARTERESGNFEAARSAATRAAEMADNLPERLDAYTEFAAAALDEIVGPSLRSEAPTLDRGLLSEALAKVDTVLQERSGLLTPSHIALELALLLGDGPSALQAWRSYFRISPAAAPGSVLAEPARVLGRDLPLWQGQPLEEATRIGLVLALADSRMFEAASLLATGAVDADPRIREITAYQSYLASIGQRTTAYYRAAAAGNGNQTAYKADLLHEARALWLRLTWPTDAPLFSVSAFEAEIDRRFGTEMNFQDANGHFGLHMGHRVIDETYQVEQYGKEASLRFISLDFMVSNGYSSWFWDGRANVGGWARDPTIIQVRRAYAGAGVGAWEQISDPKMRAETEEDIAELEPEDIRLARENPYAYLPGLARRIEHTAQDRLIGELRASRLEPSALRLAFIAEIERIDLEASIVAHEGRHAIESRYALNFLRPGANREFLAKLSEVGFSSAPFLAIGGGILTRNIGDGTSHGDANERIMRGLVEWTDRNQESIAGFDPTLPTLPQLDRLSEEQLRQAFRSMDPLAN